VSQHDLLAESTDTAAELMTTAVISVSPDCALGDVRHLLVERRVRQVPVLRNGRLVGHVTPGDLVATKVTEWVCEVCGEAVRSEQRPGACPRCDTGGEQFALQEQPPGA
jgi:predicted transcriptional regulator